MIPALCVMNREEHFQKTKYLHCRTRAALIRMDADVLTHLSLEKFFRKIVSEKIGIKKYDA